MRIFSTGNLLATIGNLATLHTIHPDYTELLTRFTSKEFVGAYEDALLRWQSIYAETISQSKLWQYQSQRLRLIANKAYHLPFYRKIFLEYGVKPEDFRSIEDLQKLPIVEKKDFRSCPPEKYIDLELGKIRGHWARTSGSTGEPFQLLQDHKGCAVARAFGLRIFDWFKISPKSRRVDFVTPRGRKSISPWMDETQQNFLLVSDFPTKVGHYAEFIDRFRPTVLESNPSYLVYFARYLAETNRNIHIPYVISYGEQLDDAERKLLEKVFLGVVINRYGLVDVTTIGAECPIHNGFHVNSLCCLVEIVDKNGKQVDNDEGDVVVTSLINEITPLIRYHTGDRGRWVHGNCPCGRTYSRFNVTGRRDDFLMLEDGRMLHASVFRGVFYKHMEIIRQFQVIQTSTHHIHAKVVPFSSLKKSDQKNIVNDLKELIGKGMIITLSEERHIPWANGGKYKSLIALPRS